LSLILSRQVGVQVTNYLPRALREDSAARMKADLALLAETKCLAASLIVPDAASPIKVQANIAQRTVTTSATIRAPNDKQSTKARVNWVLRQLQKTPDAGIHIRLHWPGRAAHTQHTLAGLRDDIDLANADREHLQVSAIEICLVKEMGGRFAQSKNFIKDLEETVPDFYEVVMQHLKAWQPPAPKLREGRSEASDVTPSAISQDMAERRSDGERMDTPENNHPIDGRDAS
jgi:hypothetical protein